MNIGNRFAGRARAEHFAAEQFEFDRARTGRAFEQIAGGKAEVTTGQSRLDIARIMYD
jgi:hypothetical protein